MALTVEQSIAVTAVLDYLLPGKRMRDGDRTSEDALAAAKLLARHASKALGAGMREEEVAKRWPKVLA